MPGSKNSVKYGEPVRGAEIVSADWAAAAAVADVAATETAGTATSFARGDHAHALGSGTVDDSSIELSAGALQCKALGIATGMLAANAVTSAKAAASLVQEATTTIATAAVKTLNATPVSLVAAGGAGTVHVLHRVLVQLNFATTGYDAPAAGADLTVNYTNGAGVAASGTLESASVIDGAADVYAFAGPAVTGIGVANAALVLYNNDATEYATGDSALEVTVWYSTVTGA